MIRSLTGNIIQLKLRTCVQRLVSVATVLLLLTDCIQGLSLLGKTSEVCRKCSLENEVLARVYQQRVLDDVRQTCVYVKEFLRCAAPLESKCREDLNFQGALTLMRSFTEERKCASMNITLEEVLETFKNQPRAGERNHTPREKRCTRPNFKPVYKICGLFGDPHLRTFSDKRNTCSVPGAWPLFANRYLTVQVTNIPLENSSRATATSKVTVIVRGLKRKCIKEKTYQARSFSLPTHFSDGTKSSGDKDCPTTVTQLRKGRRIMIDICPLKTKIIIRQVGKYLTVHMRVPKDLTRRPNTIGLCQRGCPRLQQMNLDKKSELKQLIDSFYKEDKLTKRVRREREERARKLCGRAKIKGFYYKSCIFDMLTSDDKTFVKAARKAMKDFRTINKDDEGRPIVNETVNETARGYFSAEPRTKARTTERTSTSVPSLIPSSSAYSVHKSSFSLLLVLLVLLVFR